MTLKCNLCVEEAIEFIEELCEYVYGTHPSAVCPNCDELFTEDHTDDCTFTKESFNLAREQLGEDSDAFISTSRFDGAPTFFCFNHFVKYETS